MPTLPEHPHEPAHGPVAAEALALWSADEDLALGCECADPALQIELWHHEAAARAAQPM